MVKVVKRTVEVEFEVDAETARKITTGEVQIVGSTTESRYNPATGEWWDRVNGRWVKTSPDWIFTTPEADRPEATEDVVCFDHGSG